MAFCLQLGYVQGAELNKGLILHLPFDSVGPSASGLLPKSVKAKVNGNPSFSMQFDGVDDYFEFGAMTFGDELSVSIWVSIENPKHANTLLDKYDGELGRDLSVRRSFALICYNRMQWTVSTDGKNRYIIDSKELIQANQLIHVVCNWGNGRQSMFIDGKLHVQKKAETSPVFNSPVPIMIGANKEIEKLNKEKAPRILYQNYFRGMMDNVRIYSRALSAEEVKALYDLEKPKDK